MLLPGFAAYFHGKECIQSGQQARLLHRAAHFMMEHAQ
jgi:hypothetical protein